MERSSCVVVVVAASVWPMVLALVLELAYAILDVAYVSPAHRNSSPPNKTTAMVRAVGVGLVTDYESSNSNDCQTYDAESLMSSAFGMNLLIEMHNFGRRSFVVHPNNQPNVLQANRIIGQQIASKQTEASRHELNNIPVGASFDG